MIQTLALKIGLALAIVAGACGATWFMADAHYSGQYVALKTGYEQAARDQKAQVDKTIADNAAAAKEIDAQAQQQIGSMARTIADLSVRSAAGHSAVRLCAAAPSPTQPVVQPDRPAAAGSIKPAAEPARPAVEAAIEPAILGGVLDTAIDAIRAELLWRDWARRTDQTPATR